MSYKVMVFFSNRAEKGLLKSVMKRIEESGKLELLAVDLFKDLVEPKSLDSYGLLYNSAYKLIEREKPTLVMTPFDRFEMVFPALAAFYHNIPIAQIHAGDLSLEGAWDDVTRHVLSLYASIHFCEGRKAYRRVVNMLKTLRRSTRHVYEIGSTAFDDVEIDTSFCPKEPYDLVVYCSPTKRLDLIASEIKQILSMLDKYTVWVEPSGRDPGDREIIEILKDHHTQLSSPQPYLLLKTLPRPMFLGLMKNCERFIGNSSSLFYEAPMFLKKKQIIHIGVRNKGREFVKIRRGGSKRIVKILEAFLDESQ